MPNDADRLVHWTQTAGLTRWRVRPHGREIRFASSTTATQALRLPWYNLNGVASHNWRWWFLSSGAKKLRYWTPSTGMHAYNWVAGGESISYWEDPDKPDLLWSLQEKRGHRNVFSLKQCTYGP